MSQPFVLRILLTALLPALAYYIAGALGLLLAIPPGFASAIWPAAGVALTFVLLKPTTATVIGIGVGSFAANLGVISNLSQVTLASLITPALIASGASLQAAAGAWIYRRQLGQARIFDTPAAIARFMLVVAPASCLIAASVGVGTLWGRGIITPDNVLFTWMTWWVGDTIGVLLVAPLTLEIYAHRTSPFRSRRWQILIPSCVLLVCVTVLFVFSRHSRHQQIDADIDATSAKLIQALELVFSDATQNLAAHQALFTTQNHVSWLLFDQFSQSLSHQYKGLSAVGWSPLVNGREAGAI